MQPVAFFRNPCSHGFLLGFLSLFIASSAFADEEFWVLGSFGEKHSAVLQGRHLAKVSGLRVSLHVIEINAGIRYRLLTQVLGARDLCSIYRIKFRKAGSMIRGK